MYMTSTLAGALTASAFKASRLSPAYRALPASEGTCAWVGTDACSRARSLPGRSEEHTSELQSRFDLVCRLLLEKKKAADKPAGFNVATDDEQDNVAQIL